MTRGLPIVVGLLLMGVATYVHGAWTQRWSGETAEELARFAQQYESIPSTIGPWVGEEMATNPRELDAAGAHASVSRRYKNRETGDVVSVFLVCGYARDIAVHTPDACYVGAGFTMDRQPVLRKLGSEQQTWSMRTAVFRKSSSEGTIRQRIYWGWTGDGTWEAPETPRWHYGGRSVIHKVYLIEEVAGPNGRTQESPALAFGNAFLPMVSDVIYPR